MKKIIAKQGEKYYWYNHEADVIVELSREAIISEVAENEVLFVPDSDMDSGFLFEILRGWGSRNPPESLWSPKDLR